MCIDLAYKHTQERNEKKIVCFLPFVICENEQNDRPWNQEKGKLFPIQRTQVKEKTEEVFIKEEKMGIKREN